MITKYKISKDVKPAKIEAEFGTVEVGDYVAVLMTTHNSTRITSIDFAPGIVAADGWVYLIGNTKRQIGTNGCPICKLNAKDLDAQTKQRLKAALRDAESKRAQLPNQTMYLKFEVVTRLVNIAIIQTLYTSIKYRTDVTPERQSADIDYQIDKIKCRHFSEDEIGKRTAYSYNNIHVGIKNTSDVCNLDIINRLDYNTTLTITSVDKLTMGKSKIGADVIGVTYIRDGADWVNRILYSTKNGKIFGSHTGETGGIEYML